MAEVEVIVTKEWTPDELDTELGFRNPADMSIDEKVTECLNLSRELTKSIIMLSRNPMFGAMGIQFGKR